MSCSIDIIMSLRDRVAEVAQGREGPSPKSLDENFYPLPYPCGRRVGRFVANGSARWQSDLQVRRKTTLLGAFSEERHELRSI